MFVRSAQFCAQFDAAGVGQTHIQKDHVGGKIPEQTAHLFRILSYLHGEAALSQGFPGQKTKGRIIVHDQDESMA